VYQFHTPCNKMGNLLDSTANQSHAKYGPKNTAPHCYCLKVTRILHVSFKNKDANTLHEFWVNDQLDAQLCYMKYLLL